MKLLSSNLRDLDAYPKIVDDFRVRTLSGAIVSLVSLSIIFILVVSEFVWYLRSERVDHLSVDTDRKEQLQINFNITFQKLGCEVLSLGAVDVSGEQHIDIEHNVRKTNLDENGVVAGSEKEEKLEDRARQEKALKFMGGEGEDFCGSCFGSEETPEQCCNSCDEIRQAYRNRGWSFVPTEEMSQCVEEAMERRLELSKNKGCMIHGKLMVNKVAGNFHFTPSPSFQSVQKTGKSIGQFSLDQFNLTHSVNSLSFGYPYPGIVNPLDRTLRIQEEGDSQFQYFIKVVPTQFSAGILHVINTNQYSVTEHIRRTDIGKNPEFQLGVFFVYDLSPIRVTISHRSKSFASFLTGVCAIVGGVFTVAGMIDAVIFHSINRFSKKVELGKVS